MPFQSFHDLFPDVAERETRTITVLPGSNLGLPPGQYAFPEMFCNEKGCDCRRVFFMVLASFSKEEQAVVAWGWEDIKFYRRWLKHGDREDARELQGPVLNLGSPETDLAPAILELARNVLLKDVAFTDRVRRHYRMFRDKVESAPGLEDGIENVPAPIYEEELAGSFATVLREADALYEGAGRLEQTCRRLAGRLEELGVAFNLVGGYALILHGVRRFTEDLDVLVRPEGLSKLRGELIGAGYVAVPGNSRSIRDAQTGVRIDFVLSGDFPGDGKPKDVAFPDPSAHVDVTERIHVVDMKTLIELKLASGMTARDRIQDLADVQRLIEAHRLDSAYAETLHPYVRAKFLDLWDAVRLKTEGLDGLRDPLHDPCGQQA